MNCYSPKPFVASIREISKKQNKFGDTKSYINSVTEMGRLGIEVVIYFVIISLKGPREKKEYSLRFSER